MNDTYEISSVSKLRDLLGEPSELASQKVFDYVDQYAAEFIAKAPLAVLATSDSEGRLDLSPKGDAPGFVLVEDQNTLLLPDRPGNRLAYGFENILQTGRAALIFMVPGVRETLRVNGRATLSYAPDLLERLSARGKPAVLCTRIAVEESFFHCGKAMIRSRLWQPDSWPENARANLGKQLSAKLAGSDELTDHIDAALEDSYVNEL
ncbi:MAG: pyridoxamine 5'-phosphate oxidase family protein [Halieaceae bacterium]|nr:pyridoxamine 5'-phosphate oxidase family protein [Halieaceae bacterium]